MSSASDRSPWTAFLPPILMTLALIGFAAVFLLEASAFRAAIVGWARRDLRSQAELAAGNLREPLETQNFARIDAWAKELRAKGLLLSVFSAQGGVIFAATTPDETIAERVACGEFAVQVATESSRVLAPFRRALRGFLLAFLVGGLGVLLVFFVIYRQKVRIRELARLEAFRRDFIADVSHEIKTPLTGILGAVDLLAGDSPLIPLIRRESTRLNSLVQSILDLSRLEHEGDILARTQVDLADLVRETAARFEVKVGACPALSLSCDAALVSQALTNLVVNARRHAGTDDITVSCGRQKGGAVLVVEDHGVGIPAAEASRVFERFHRVDPARAAETGGAGLGLAIVRRIARLHGGEVSLEPASPSGCRFTLFLPC